MADEVLKQGVQGISDIIVDDALINLDFADVTTIMKDRGIVHMGVGRGKGENKLEDAVSGAINSPLLETKISGARAVLINITGGRDLTMFDVDKVASRIDEEADDNAIIIMGASIKEEFQDEIAVTVIAAGFEKSNVDLLNSSVIPNTRVVETAAPAEPVQETAAVAEDEPFKGTARIDIPSFLQR
jgi:cell division protein FtsZ